MSDISQCQKDLASGWFMSLRDEIVSAFELLEERHVEGSYSDHPKGTFDVTPTKRQSESGENAGGGVMSVLRGGRVFEKVGVNVSTVFGILGTQAQNAMATRKGIPGMKEDLHVSGQVVYLL